ncbi:unnamed protein product, partial [Owenia fusiformis]
MEMFSWQSYLERYHLTAAPTGLFTQDFPMIKNRFKVGMKLELADPRRAPLYSVATVAEVLGCRMRLTLDSYSDSYDVWCRMDSMDLFPSGWAARNGKHLQPPNGYSGEFPWQSYLKKTKMEAAPESLFQNGINTQVLSNHSFKVGRKLEAPSKEHPDVMYVGTVKDIHGGRILVQLDNCAEQTEYWSSISSPCLHPVGWSKENGKILRPPKEFDGDLESFSWPIYLQKVKALPVPLSAFKQADHWEVNMSLEAVDLLNPTLIRVARIAEVNNHKIKIHFDGYPAESDFWLDCDSVDIFPCGWCKETGHPLESPPLYPANTRENMTERCNGGKGHKNGSQEIQDRDTVVSLGPPLKHLKVKKTARKTMRQCPLVVQQLEESPYTRLLPESPAQVITTMRQDKKSLNKEESVPSGSSTRSCLKRKLSPTLSSGEDVGPEKKQSKTSVEHQAHKEFTYKDPKLIKHAVTTSTGKSTMDPKLSKYYKTRESHKLKPSKDRILSNSHLSKDHIMPSTQHKFKVPDKQKHKHHKDSRSDRHRSGKEHHHSHSSNVKHTTKLRLCEQVAQSSKEIPKERSSYKTKQKSTERHKLSCETKENSTEKESSTEKSKKRSAAKESSTHKRKESAAKESSRHKTKEKSTAKKILPHKTKDYYTVKESSAHESKENTHTIKNSTNKTKERSTAKESSVHKIKEDSMAKETSIHKGKYKSITKAKEKSPVIGHKNIVSRKTNIKGEISMHTDKSRDLEATQNSKLNSSSKDESHKLKQVPQVMRSPIRGSQDLKEQKQKHVVLRQSPRKACNMCKEAINPSPPLHSISKRLCKDIRHDFKKNREPLGNFD